MEDKIKYQLSKLSDLEIESLRECRESTRNRLDISANYRLRESLHYEIKI